MAFIMHLYDMPGAMRKIFAPWPPWPSESPSQIGMDVVGYGGIINTVYEKKR
jgi:hypothetical protein